MVWSSSLPLQEEGFLVRSGAQSLKMPRTPKRLRFHVQAKNYFLTYPRCSISKSDALDQIKSLNFPISPKFIRVGQEEHHDGSAHLHVLIQFDLKYSCTNERFFDLTSLNCSRTFHPNIQGAKSSSDVNNYITKHSDYVAYGDFQSDARSARTGGLRVNKVYANALNASTKEEAKQIIREGDPRFYLLQYHKISPDLDRIFDSGVEEFHHPFEPDSFDVPAEMSEWARRQITTDTAARPDMVKSIIVEGDTLLGKTLWARSLGPHNYLSGYLDLNSKDYSNNATYNVIDHIDPPCLAKKHWKELIGAQRDWQAKYKYSKPTQIKGGIPAIVLCNPGVGFSYKEYLERSKNKALKEWTKNHVIFVTITKPLFKLSNFEHQDPTSIAETATSMPQTD